MPLLVAVVLAALTTEVVIYLMNVPMHTGIHQVTTFAVFTVPATPWDLRSATTVAFICVIDAVQSVVRRSEGSTCNENASAALARTYSGIVSVKFNTWNLIIIPWDSGAKAIA